MRSATGAATCAAATGILAATMLVACGGGGSSPGQSSTGPATVGLAAPTPTTKPSGAPTTTPSASPSHGPTTRPTVPPTAPPTAPPTVLPTVPPTTAPSLAPVVNATSAPIYLTDNPAIVYGNPISFSAAGATGTTPIDGIPCVGAFPRTAQHFHVHFTLFVSGQQYAIPAAIGIYHPKRLYGPAYAGWYNLDPADPTACHYDIHVHAGDGVIHIETQSSTATFNLKQFLDIWGVSMSTTGFWTFTGPTRWFETDEVHGASGTHKVAEITGADPATIQLTPHTEFTVEVSTPAVNTQNFIFIDKNDL